MLHQLRSLAVFAAVVEKGSLRAAAKALQLSPSVVSHHISQLEEQLGVALLYRSTRKISLTRNGERLLSHAQVMVKSAEDGINAALDGVSELSGALRVTAPALLANSPIASKISEFAKLHPKVHLSLDFSEMTRDVIADGIDVAIRAGVLRDSQLKSRKLFDEPRSLLAASDYLKTMPEPRSPKDLVDWNWLELAPVPLNPEFTHENGKRIQIRPKSSLTCNNADALYTLCKRGVGLAILPSFMADADLGLGVMKAVLPEWSLNSIGFYAVRPPNSPEDGLATQFIKALAV